MTPVFNNFITLAFLEEKDRRVNLELNAVLDNFIPVSFVHNFGVIEQRPIMLTA
jgi:hypothetical protein